jgi:hypothetical protein
MNVELVLDYQGDAEFARLSHLTSTSLWPKRSRMASMGKSPV